MGWGIVGTAKQEVFNSMGKLLTGYAVNYVRGLKRYGQLLMVARQAGSFNPK